LGCGGEGAVGDFSIPVHQVDQLGLDPLHRRRDIGAIELKCLLVFRGAADGKHLLPSLADGGKIWTQFLEVAAVLLRSDCIFVALKVDGELLGVLVNQLLHMPHSSGVALGDVTEVVSSQQQHVAADGRGVDDAGDGVGGEGMYVLADAVEADHGDEDKCGAEEKQSSRGDREALSDRHVRSHV
jgi:hypothetical protein